MIETIETSEFLNIRDSGTLVVDVRTPAEFAESHIPKAVNIPLFTDDERIIVGTKYKKSNREAAIIQGLDFVGPKLSSYIKILRKQTFSKDVLIHCWRGGMRSKSMAWLFDLYGFNVKILNGGYKAYRKHVISSFETKAQLIVLGGMTGSGKSEILNSLKEKGQQIIDLEDIANHKGSAFGALGQAVQPTTSQFQNNLFEVWKKLNFDKPIWIEDESANIGKVSLPKELYKQIRESKLVLVELDKSIRIKRLIIEYAIFTDDELIQSVNKISKRLGDQSTQLCIESIKNKDYYLVADLTLNYYDKAYRNGLSKRDKDLIYSININENNKELNAQNIIDFSKSIELIP